MIRPIRFITLAAGVALVAAALSACSTTSTVVGGVSPTSSVAEAVVPTTFPTGTPAAAPGAPPPSIVLNSAAPPGLRLPAGATVGIKPLTPKTRSVLVQVPSASFGFGKDESVPIDEAAATTQVRELLTSIRADPRDTIESIAVDAYASSEGSPQRNAALTEARAQWACAALRSAGADPARLTCRGLGSASDLPPSGPGPEDRRVEIAFVVRTAD